MSSFGESAQFYLACIGLGTGKMECLDKPWWVAGESGGVGLQTLGSASGKVSGSQSHVATMNVKTSKTMALLFLFLHICFKNAQSIFLTPLSYRVQF